MFVILDLIGLKGWIVFLPYLNLGMRKCANEEFNFLEGDKS